MRGIGDKMSDAQKRLDEYEARPTAELIENAEHLIYAMCRDGAAKHWLMSVPVSPGDSDIILAAALDSAKKRIADLEAQLAEARRHNELLRAVAVSLDSYFSCDINNSNLMDNLQGRLEKALLSAIDGGALEDNAID